MNIRQAREAWHERIERASAALTWPVQEWKAPEVPERPDPSQDPQYPYMRDWEQERMADGEAYEALRVREYNNALASKDDFDPSVNKRLYVPLYKISRMSGEGAIYTPEYLERIEARKGC